MRLGLRILGLRQTMLGVSLDLGSQVMYMYYDYA